MSSADDTDLVARARGGDSGAFRALVERYQRRAYALALHVVHNPTDALDICQEAFIKVHRHLGGFQGGSAFYTWLYRIVMNLCLDHLRRSGRHAEVDFDDALAHETDGADAPAGLPQRFLADPQEALRQKELRGALEAALARLSPTHRQVIVLREVDGLSYEEMAETMRCSKGTIMSRLFYARKAMQRHLRGALGEDGAAEAAGVERGERDAGGAGRARGGG